MRAKSLITAFVLLLFLAMAGGYYYSIYPPVVLKHKLQKVLTEFSIMVATRDRAKIGEALNGLLAESSPIKLEVKFAPALQQNTPGVTQEFDKKSFLPFIDNILYSLENYYFDAQVQEFNLSPDRKSALVTFHSSSWAEDRSGYMGVATNTHFNVDTTCSGEVAFNETTVTFSKVSCTLDIIASL